MVENKLLCIENKEIEKFAYRLLMMDFFQEKKYKEIIFECENLCIVYDENETIIYSFLTYDTKRIQKIIKLYKNISKIVFVRDAEKPNFSEKRINGKFDSIISSETVNLTKCFDYSDLHDIARRIFLIHREFPRVFEIFFGDFNSNNIKCDIRKTYYKYKGMSNYTQSLVDGIFTYTNPLTLNDPFDCDFDIDYGSPSSINYSKSIKDQFRVLSLTPHHNSILMWSYYGGDHKGVCVGHELNDFFVSTSRFYSGILIYGNVEYSYKRPKYKYDAAIMTKVPFFRTLSLMTKCCFTKYKKWEHENEFRLLTFVDCFDKDFLYKLNNRDYIEIQGKSNIVCLGCNYVPYSVIVPKTPTVIKYCFKDLVEYKII